MEVSLLSHGCIKIKSKRGTIIVDPNKLLRGKILCDAIMLLKSKDVDYTKIEGQRVIIDGPGEYEVSGIKIMAYKHGQELFYNMSIDGISTVLGSVEIASRMKDTLGGNNVVILHADGQLDQSEIAALEPNVALVYGQKGEGLLGTDASKTSKFTVTREKLPEKMEIVLLQ